MLKIAVSINLLGHKSNESESEHLQIYVTDKQVLWIMWVQLELQWICSQLTILIIAFARF